MYDSYRHEIDVCRAQTAGHGSGYWSQLCINIWPSGRIAIEDAQHCALRTLKSSNKILLHTA